MNLTVRFRNNCVQCFHPVKIDDRTLCLVGFAIAIPKVHIPRRTGWVFFLLELPKPSVGSKRFGIADLSDQIHARHKLKCSHSLLTGDDPGSKPTMVRLKHWSTLSDACAGQFIRWICSVGAADLPWVTSSRHMFLNKIRMELDLTAFRCLEQWYIERVRQETRNSPEALGANFNVSVYSGLAFVSNHV